MDYREKRRPPTHPDRVPQPQPLPHHPRITTDVTRGYIYLPNMYVNRIAILLMRPTLFKYMFSFISFFYRFHQYLTDIRA